MRLIRVSITIACFAPKFLIAAVATTANFGSLPAGPTEYEQYMLELLNRARADPSAEVTRLSGQAWDGTPDLNEGNPSPSITTAAKQPLAFNQALINAARNHVAWSFLNESFNHFEGAAPSPNLVNWTGNFPTDRTTFAGYPGSVGENTAIGVSSSATAFSTSSTITTAAASRHNDLFVDSGVPGRGHRVNFMNAAYTEVGIGFFTDSDYTGPFGSAWARSNMANYNFGMATSAILTGVAYNDLDTNGFYTPDMGESLGGIMVKVFSGDTLVGTATTWSSGGYSLTGLASGTYEVRFENGLGAVYSAGYFTLGAENVKVDAISPIFVPEPATHLFLLGFVSVLGLRRFRFCAVMR